MLPGNCQSNQGKRELKGKQPRMSQFSWHQCSEPLESWEPVIPGHFLCNGDRWNTEGNPTTALSHAMFPLSVITPPTFEDPHEVFIINCSQDYYFALCVSQLRSISVGYKGQFILGSLLSASRQIICFQADLTIFLTLVHLFAFFLYVLFCCVFMVPKIKPKILRRLSKCKLRLRRPSKCSPTEPHPICTMCAFKHVYTACNFALLLGQS